MPNIKRVIFFLDKSYIVWNRHRTLDEACHGFLTQGKRDLEPYLFY